MLSYFRSLGRGSLALLMIAMVGLGDFGWSTLALAQPDTSYTNRLSNILWVGCLRQSFPGVQRSGDGLSAFDPKTGRNFAYEDGKWIDTKTLESICPGKGTAGRLSNILWVGCLTQSFPGVRRSGDGLSAFDPKTGRNFAYEDGKWIDTKTLESICPRAPSQPAERTPAPPQQPVRTASAFESGVLNEINRARTDPTRYTLISDRYPAGPVEVGRAFLRTAQPIAPLTWGDGIALAAGVQADDQGPKGQDSHVGADGSTPMARMQRAGVWSMMEDEVISVGQDTPAGVVAQLIIDPPDTLHLHRSVLFDPMMKSAGVACGPNTRFGIMCVIDVAGAPVPRD